MNPDHLALTSQQISFIAVAICRTRHGNTHTGVAYRAMTGDVQCFHQAWDHITRNGPIDTESNHMEGPFFCVSPTVETDRARAIAAFWEFVAGQGETIGYALRDDPDAHFDENTGRLVLLNGNGLSCSTFVLALFRSVSFPYIDTTGWPIDRAGDREAQERLMRVLEHTCLNKNHIDQVKQEIGCERIRPEEVAGAALSESLPVRHPDAEDAGHYICGALAALGRLGRVGMS